MQMTMEGGAYYHKKDDRLKVNLSYGFALNN